MEENAYAEIRILQRALLLAVEDIPHFSGLTDSDLMARYVERSRAELERET